MPSAYRHDIPERQRSVTQYIRHRIKEEMAGACLSPAEEALKILKDTRVEGLTLELLHQRLYVYWGEKALALGSLRKQLNSAISLQAWLVTDIAQVLAVPIERLYPNPPNHSEALRLTVEGLSNGSCYQSAAAHESALRLHLDLHTVVADAAQRNPDAARELVGTMRYELAKWVRRQHTG